MIIYNTQRVEYRDDDDEGGLRSFEGWLEIFIFLFCFNGTVERLFSRIILYYWMRKRYFNCV